MDKKKQFFKKKIKGDYLQMNELDDETSVLNLADKNYSSLRQRKYPVNYRQEKFSIE
jgi:hypothetical protein